MLSISKLQLPGSLLIAQCGQKLILLAEDVKGWSIAAGSPHYISFDYYFCNCFLYSAGTKCLKNLSNGLWKGQSMCPLFIAAHSQSYQSLTRKLVTGKISPRTSDWRITVSQTKSPEMGVVPRGFHTGSLFKASAAWTSLVASEQVTAKGHWPACLNSS